MRSAQQVAVGRLDPQKGVHRLSSIYHALALRAPRINLTIAGGSVVDAARAEGNGVMSTNVLETVTSLRRTRLESMLKVLDVDGAVRRVRGGWESTGESWVYDSERYQRVEAARLGEQDSMLRYERLEAPQCRMAFLRAALDDPEMPEGWRCGKCDLCGGLDLATAASATEVEAARESLTRVGVSLEPRKQWPRLIDGRNALDLAAWRGAGFEARGLGRS